ncbi:hypothetical protein EDD18DRAFT_251404 [Armillaria luteobubalina]|uniref:Uncharacterized protein n=1 Tax=Armillaria luteobubalina TaxID=153913 RepID=A0AA39Q3S1_9AGAR|nr:hypothetical protein EDD18DRAFT_251404 [Armillaria luteobubalina]
MASLNRNQIAHDNASSNLSLALLSSSMPALAVGSPSNDAASVMGKDKDKGKLSRFFKRRGKHGYIDTTGDIAPTSSDSEDPVLQSNKSSTTSTSQPLANAQIKTIMASQNNHRLAGILSENKTTNAAAILEIVKTICDILDKVPYIKVVAGLVTIAVTTIEARRHFAVRLLY